MRPPKVVRLPEVSQPIELDLDAIADEIAKNRAEGIGRNCKGKDCTTQLSRYTRGPLCNQCQAKQKSAKHTSKLKEMDRCSCGRALPTDGGKSCTFCRLSAKFGADFARVAEVSA